VVVVVVVVWWCVVCGGVWCVVVCGVWWCVVCVVGGGVWAKQGKVQRAGGSVNDGFKAALIRHVRLRAARATDLKFCVSARAVGVALGMTSDSYAEVIAMLGSNEPHEINGPL
jgi:hypothetical protein